MIAHLWAYSARLCLWRSHRYAYDLLITVLTNQQKTQVGLKLVTINPQALHTTTTAFALYYSGWEST